MLRLSLVSVPVRAYTAMETGQGEVHLHQLHRECHNRIRYQKVCPVHGEVTNDEIEMGYEYAKDQYVEIEPSERNKAHARSDKAIEIDRFVPIGSVDPLYFAGRNYYLVPDGASAQKPYAVFFEAMKDGGRGAVAQMAMSGRDQTVFVRPQGDLLVLCVLNFRSQLKDPGQFSEEAPHVHLKAEELRLAKTLIDSTSSDEPDLERFEDTYTEKLREVIEAKIEGREVVAPPEDGAPQVVNLMEALRKSVEQRKGGKKTARKMAPSKRELTSPPRKRKSS